MAETKLVAENRRARHDYEIIETYEAGLVLLGWEVKSLREGRVSLKDAYARPRGEEIFLLNCHISPYSHATNIEADPERPRKLLLKKREIKRLIGRVTEKGLTLIPLRIYFNRRGYAKVEIALARGRKLYDKREVAKRRTIERELRSALKEKQR
ncbi:MAG: SsrA-binding protein SmpB [Acidobacteria bacterium]|nr:SsrA-binding protein SmpB [Acidobacteriota bacterium]